MPISNRYLYSVLQRAYVTMRDNMDKLNGYPMLDKLQQIKIIDVMMDVGFLTEAERKELLNKGLKILDIMGVAAPVDYVDPDGREDLDIPGAGTLDTKTGHLTPPGSVKGMTLTPKEVGNIIFHESRSYTGDKVHEGRINTAHAIINADIKWGDKRYIHAKAASLEDVDVSKLDKVETAAYNDSQASAQEAIAEAKAGIDPTKGSTFFNQRGYSGTEPFKISQTALTTKSEPLHNSNVTKDLPAEGCYMNTYEYDKN